MVYFTKECPHCGQFVLIDIADINCGIFRHGVTKQDFGQMNPHETKPNCDSLAEAEAIYGCGKPFRVVKIAEGAAPELSYKLEACDYV